MSDLPTLHAKIDTIMAIMATRDDLNGLRATTVSELNDMRAAMATRDDLTELRAAMASELSELRATMVSEFSDMRATMATRDDLARLRATVATRDELTGMRTVIMDRMDRLQDAVSLQHYERIVDVASAERCRGWPRPRGTTPRRSARS